MTTVGVLRQNDGRWVGVTVGYYERPGLKPLFLG